MGSIRELLWYEADEPQVMDWHGALRDTFLAGGFSGATAGAVLGSWEAAAVGFGGGAFLGRVLHVAPRNYENGSRMSRILLRAASGALAGAGNGSSLAKLWLREEDPVKVRRAVTAGAISGALFYALWGAIEPRAKAHPANRAGQ
jgi:hypothetical protein